MKAPATSTATILQGPRPPGYEALDEPFAGSPALAAAVLTLLILLAAWLSMSLARMAWRHWKERER